MLKKYTYEANALYDEKFRDPVFVSVFPTIVHQVLSAINTFPSPHTVSIHFCNPLDEDIIDLSNTARSTRDWWVLMDRTHAALSENHESYLNSLDVRPLLNKKFSTLHTHIPHETSGTLERVDLLIPNDMACAWWGLDDQRFFSSNLDEFCSITLKCEKFQLPKLRARTKIATPISHSTSTKQSANALS